MALVVVVALRYSYNTMSTVEASIGFTILLIIGGFLWIYHRRSSQRHNSTVINHAILAGLALGGLWVVEIGVNNFIAPPLPARDIIDNLFWAFIALTIFGFATHDAYRTDSLTRGIEVGTWSGFVSGLLACSMALFVIVFGMRFITQDPLNVAEWAKHGISSHAPSMVAYLAFETFAGAFLHLVVLGITMGVLLGVMGGIIGKSIRQAGGLMHPT